MYRKASSQVSNSANGPVRSTSMKRIGFREPFGSELFRDIINSDTPTLNLDRPQ